MCLYNLGFVLNDWDGSSEAEKLLHESFESSRQVLGPEHPTTLRTMSTLGALLIKLGRLDDAEKLLRPCLEAQRRILGPNHHETRHTAGHLDAFVEEALHARTRQSRSTSPH